MRDQLTDKRIATQIASDFRTADIDDVTKAILEFAVKVTETAHTVTPEDLNKLRDFGLTDEALFAIVEVVGFFSYVNRIADAFGIELDDFLEQRWTSEPEQ
ncbi:MAG: peroxidase [Candidatus Poribacteria bacterium]|nr:peroxidase [Candidatus Poribacteria bacterium]MDE0315322.1 peroxidase [Candidatus Poribacteria bacterium]